MQTTFRDASLRPKQVIDREFYFALGDKIESRQTPGNVAKHTSKICSGHYYLGNQFAPFRQ